MNLSYLKKLLNYKLINFYKKHKTSFVLGYPYWLTIDPCSICNLRCVFCPTGQHRGSRTQTKMSFKQFKKIIDKLGPYLIFIEFCNWGEPLLNPELANMILYTKKYSIKNRISTNLHLNLNYEEIENILTSGIDWMTVSIDGASQETYEIYRRGGNFGVVIENLKSVVKIKKELGLKLPHIHWQFLVFKHNEHEIEKAKILAKEIGVDSIGFTAPYCSIEWASTIEEYNRYKKIDEKIDYKTREETCNWLWDGITINSNGSISPCCSVEDEKDDFDNFFEKPFWKIWNGKKYRIARKFVRDRKLTKENNIICLKCDHIGASNHSEIKL
jgi:MoaA/NifB/PqqE/SkfB family radical SAM enzyme